MTTEEEREIRQRERSKAIGIRAALDALRVMLDLPESKLLAIRAMLEKELSE